MAGANGPPPVQILPRTPRSQPSQGLTLGLAEQSWQGEKARVRRRGPVLQLSMGLNPLSAAARKYRDTLAAYRALAADSDTDSDAEDVNETNEPQLTHTAEAHEGDLRRGDIAPHTREVLIGMASQHESAPRRPDELQTSPPPAEQEDVDMDARPECVAPDGGGRGARTQMGSFHDSNNFHLTS
ncbi:hypothetical protein PF005_g23914 [Phytophthora fragariae]|uniref:Uncharacterized protein n=2 Tax=Phytophthora fragariae TaxID=53985 RepID=A0A6A3WAG9_9STRA|nr:hypothetical protein PF003_g3689 [Phytophthora fragariae]KAE8925998.1 hypothetical protein PF009_g23802 [Phytophthora fragariae]KAE9070462.1 hypothetical protein PF007_g26931 [Phytophthora fragariae]KAE9072725.1 hypothetical protein PF010_g25370 [Phytophthora fragariae]KAE9178837.1 hypothetical protein PF005_g23914 [Phytophthora fragariae]